MKKHVRYTQRSTALALSLLLVLSACGGGSSSKNPSGGSSAPVSSSVPASSSAPVSSVSVSSSLKSSSVSSVVALSSVAVSSSLKSSSSSVAVDVTPDAFTFAPVSDVAPNSIQTAAAITVTGIDAAVPISVIGGEYAINGSAFTSAAGTVSKGQSVTLRGTAGSDTDTTTHVDLTISNASASFVINTVKDTSAPTAQIYFPPPVAMTEDNRILVRGTASDDYHGVKSVTVNGVAATSTDDYKNWQAEVPLADTTTPPITLKNTVNTLKVIAEDSVGNKTKTEEAPKVVVTQGDRKQAFPSESITFKAPTRVVLDNRNGRNRLLVAEPYGYKIIAIDFATGERSKFASLDFSNYSMVLDPTSERLLVAGSRTFASVKLSDGSVTKYQINDPWWMTYGVFRFDESEFRSPLAVVQWDYVADAHRLFTLDPVSLTLTKISSANENIPDAETPLDQPRAIVFDKTRNRYLVAVGGQNEDELKHGIYAVDATTGKRSVFSSSLVGKGPAFEGKRQDFLVSGDMNMISELLIDSEAGYLIEAEFMGGRFMKIDLKTGDRAYFSNSETGSANNRMLGVWGMALVQPNNYLLSSDANHLGIYAVDVVTGERVVFSKSAHEEY